MHDPIIALLALALLVVVAVAVFKGFRPRPKINSDPEAFYDKYPAYNPDGTQYRGPDNPRAIPGTRQPAPANWMPTDK